jgi:hypothetical protein
VIRVGLVGCGSRKGAAPAKARDLYEGCGFADQLGYATRPGRYDRVYILSAKFLLVGLDQVVPPYDVSLDDYSRVERLAWGRMVADLLFAQLKGVPARVEVLAGAKYVAPFRAAVRPGWGWDVRAPLEGLSQGRRRGWFKARRDEDGAQAAKAPGAALFPASLVFRIPRWKRDAVRLLSKRTRVPYSAYMREALEDLFQKYADQLAEPAGPAKKRTGTDG